MPFKSKSQMRWMFKNEPEMAKEWAAHTKKMEKLPEKVDKPHHSGKGTKARLNTAAEKHFFNTQSS